MYGREIHSKRTIPKRFNHETIYILVYYSSDKQKSLFLALRARLNLAKCVNHKQCLIGYRNGNNYIIASLRDPLQTESLLSKLIISSY